MSGLYEFVYVLPDKKGGVTTVVKNLLLYRSNDIYCKVILLQSENDDSSCQIDESFNCDEQIRLEYNPNWESKYEIAKKIKKYLNESSVLISNDGGIELDAISILKINIPVVYIIHGDYDYYYNVVKCKNNVIDGIISVSEFVATNLAQMTFENMDISIISIKYPLSIITPQRTQEVEQIRLVFVGSLNKHKGVALFKGIVDILEQNSIPYHLTIIGDGEERKNLENQFSENQNIVLTGQLSNQQVLELHNQHDVLLLPSYGEGLPVCIIEGMNAGVVPIVSNLRSGIPEVVETDVTGFRVEAGNVEAFAEKIIFLHQNRTKLNLMRRNCIEFAARQFNPYIQTQKFEEEYVRIISQFHERINYGSRKLKQKILNSLPGIFERKLVGLFK